MEFSDGVFDTTPPVGEPQGLEAGVAAMGVYLFGQLMQVASGTVFGQPGFSQVKSALDAVGSDIRGH
ncbi:hypothetical protein [Allosalinactinospora lopnorensis]|uniref:hypothetical protein n=1 Tax=Allosalinactinospora lopnorensis TaxID=1352348 RepID=UPI0012E2B8C2|nr:hypothetical protein [Allosalinactinospora lopnorensis]